MENIIIYTNKTCPYCQAIKDELTKENIEFNERVTIEWLSNWNEVVSLTGLPSVPTIIYKDEYFVPGRDFRSAPHLIEILKTFENYKHDNSIELISQKLKTLNFNTQQAFGKLDYLLKQIENKLNIQDNEHKSTN